MILKKLHFRVLSLILIFSCLNILACFSNKRNNKNEDGLTIITEIREYKKIIKSYPSYRLVLLKDYLKPFPSDIYYSTPDNFTGQALYQNHQVYANLETALKLKNVQDSLIKLGYNLLIYDVYRPYSVTKKMWEIVPDERYAANPSKGSGHNRGIAVDLSLANFKTGEPVVMPTGYDNFSDTAHHDFMKLQPIIIENRRLLKSVMEHFGFTSLSTEWWHYSLPEPRKYPIFDLSFDQLN